MATAHKGVDIYMVLRGDALYPLWGRDTEAQRP